MNITITGRHFTIKDAFREHIEKKLTKFDRFFEEDAEAHVTVTVEKERQTVEVTIRNRGMIYRAEETTKDMLKSFDDAIDSLTRQINKNKARLVKRLKSSAFEGEQIEPIQSYGDIRVKKFTVKPMTIDEAILQMNLLDHEFFTFINEENDAVNVIYKRHDGSYGILEPIAG